MKPLAKSLKWRLALFLTLAVTLSWPISILFSSQKLAHEIDEVFDASLEQTAYRLLPLIGREFERGNFVVVEHEQDDEEHDDDDHDDDEDYFDDDDYQHPIDIARLEDDDVSYIVRSRGGGVLLRASSADPNTFPKLHNREFRSINGARYFALEHPRGHYMLIVAEDLRERKSAVNESRIALITPLLFIAPLLILAIWYIVHHALKPVSKLQSEIETRGQGNLAPIDIQNLPAELEIISIAINRLLERLKRTLNAERLFTAQAAHELRTPVAASLAQIERLISKSNDPNVKASAENAYTSLARLNRLNVKLLELSKADGGFPESETRVDLRTVLGLLIREFDADGYDVSRITQNLPNDPVWTNYDPDAYAILVRNMLANAFLHGCDNTNIDLKLEADGGIFVGNFADGFERNTFASLDEAADAPRPSLKGNGLGLTIMTKIAKALGGKISMTHERRDERIYICIVFSKLG